ncbi:hypothetical protein Taro_014901 [Colocasia esculenta]|uniref:RING-type domain-containing protein n=1 Tax=Colocasia esculenta TaxID=4460 RepID=A0A843UG48_COLES|nr:hypothetical protein [Colocasia esculenta]
MMWRKQAYTRQGKGPAAMSVESQLALDEAVAKALQYVEEKLAATSSSETNVTEAVILQEASADSTQDSTTSTEPSDQATRQDDIDPDNMTYEELQSLGEAIGAESRGLTDDVISLLPSSMYKGSQDEFEECVICCMSYKDEEMLITLPCRHHYHSHCVAQWLRINKVCPICNDEVFGLESMRK